MEDNPLVWTELPSAAWAAILMGPIAFTVIYRVATRLGRRWLDPAECLADGLHQPGFLVLILGAITVGLTSVFSRRVGWYALLAVPPGALLAAGYSLWWLRWGLASVRTKEWVFAEDGSPSALRGESIKAAHADIHVYWSPTLIIWETGQVFVTDHAGRIWVNSYPNLAAANEALRRLRTDAGLSAAPSGGIPPAVA